MQRGIFISFEGSEGCGKSTQIRLLVEYLQEKGQTLLETREPGGTIVGEKIRELLQFDADLEGLTPESELLLFAASRAQLVRERILPALDAGTWVIADRFFDSTTVYQGGARGLGSEVVRAVNQFAVGDAVPDLTLLLDLDAALGHQRAAHASGSQYDRIESESMDFFETVRRSYLKLAEEESQRMVVVDASRSIEEVACSIREIVTARFFSPEA